MTCKNDGVIEALLDRSDDNFNHVLTQNLTKVPSSTFLVQAITTPIVVASASLSQIYDFLKTDFQLPKNTAYDMSNFIKYLQTQVVTIRHLPTTNPIECNSKTKQAREMYLITELISKMIDPNYPLETYDKIKQKYENENAAPLTASAPLIPPLTAPAPLITPLDPAPAPLIPPLNPASAPLIPPLTASAPLISAPGLSTTTDDIERLNAAQTNTDIGNFKFSKQSLNLLNGRKFRDFSRNNRFFNINWASRTLTPKAERYYGRTYKDYADLLSALLVTGRESDSSGIKTLQYPATLPSTVPGLMVTSVIADMNHDFEYVKPRLNTLNTASLSSFFTSKKATAVNKLHKSFKKTHKEQYNTFKGDKDYADKMRLLTQLEQNIGLMRGLNYRANNVETAQNVQIAKDLYEQTIDEMIHNAVYRHHKKELQRLKAKVLSNQDLIQRAEQHIYGTEAPGEEPTSVALGGRNKTRKLK